MARFNRGLHRRRGTNGLPEVSLTPLIDTALTLLIIFMVTTPMIQNAIKIDLPRGAAREAEPAKQELIVYIDKSGVIFLNNNAITEEKLLAELKNMTTQKGQQGVFVKADTTVQYGKVLELVDHIKTIGGIHYVALATQKRVS